MNSDLLIQLMHSYKVSFLLFYAVDIGIFNYLTNQIAADDLCKICSFHSVEKMQIMLNIFVRIGLLKKEQEWYCLKSEYKELLVSTSAHSMVHLLKLEKFLMENNNTYNKLVYAMENDSVDDFNNQHKYNMEYTYGQAMENGGRYAALQVSRIFRKLTMKEPRILDVGGGTGSYAIAIANVLKNAQIDIYERPEMESLCRNNIILNRMEESISYKSIDITKEEIPQKYDGILMSNILHLFSREIVLQVMKKASNGLSKDGILVLHDFFLEDNHTEPLQALLFTIDWLLIGAKFNYSTNDMKRIGETYELELVDIKRYKELPTTSLVFVKRSE